MQQQQEPLREHQSAEMPFLEHLAELRSRLFVCIATVLLFSVLAFNWATELFAFLTQPLLQHAGANVRLIGTGPAEAFIVKLKVAIGAGIVLSVPVLLFQLWQFVAPGLLERERRFAVPFVTFSSFCFIVGIAFCYTLVLPYAFDFFVDEFSSIGVSPEIKIGEYLSFTIRILLVFGLIFELPILSFFGSLLGLVRSEWLIAHARYAIVILFICAALLTPPDVVTQCLLAVPLLSLYVLSIGIAREIERRKKFRTTEEKE